MAEEQNSAREKSPRKGGWLRRVGVLFLGLLIAVLLLEGALRVVGFLHVRESYKKGQKSGEGTTRILCFGDSFTFGVGAASGEDYPSQLEKLLNVQAGAKRFTVINRGVGGHNTAQILSDFRGCVDDINPDAVVVMAGCHNPWNLWGYNEYKKGNTFWVRTQKLLYRVRVFKLVKLLVGNIKDKRKQGKKTPTQTPPAQPSGEKKPEPDEPSGATRTEEAKGGGGGNDDDHKKHKGGNGNGDEDEAHEGGNGDEDEKHEGGNGDDDEDDKDEDMGFAGLIDTAIVRFERLRETDNSWDTLIKLLHKKQYPAAVKWLEARAATEPKNAIIHFGLGAIAFKQKQHAQAIARFKAGMLADPQETENYCATGNVYWEQRKYDEAIRWYKEAIKIVPRDPGNYSQVGRLHLDKNDQAGALRWFKKGIEVGHDTANYLGIVDIYLLRNKHDEALGWLQKAIKHDPNHSELLNRMGLVHVRKRKYAEAIRYFERGIAANPKDIGNYEELCRVLRESRLPASKSVLKKLREAARTNKIVRNYISFLQGRGRGGKDFNNEAQQWAHHDLLEMIKICKQRKIPMIIQSYPQPSLPLKDFALSNGALFVDNEEVFTGLEKRGEKHEKYFVPDGHCNARGYGVIARNIYQVMRKAGLFKLKPLAK